MGEAPSLNGIVAFTVSVFLVTIALWPPGSPPPEVQPHDHAGRNIVGLMPYEGPDSAAEIRSACLGGGLAALDCYRGHLLAILDGRGAVASFDVLVDILALDGEIAGYAHALAHDLGRRAFESYGDIETALDNCSYEVFQGCLHGALEMHYSGLHSLTKRDVDVCSMDDTLRRALCIHGIGHGLMLYTNANVNASLGYCDWLSGGDDKKACWGGVFMENLVGFYDAQAGKAHHHAHASEGPPGYLVESDDPYFPCSIIAPAYEAACWEQIVDYMLWRSNSDWEQVASDCDGAEGIYRNLCRKRIGTVAYGWTGSVGGAVEKCGFGDPVYRPDCIRGIVDQAVLNRFDAAAGIAACKEMPESDKAVCYAQVPIQGRGIAGPRIGDVCNRAEPAYIMTCRDAAGLR